MTEKATHTPKIRLFVEDDLFPGARVTLGRDDSHYLLNVMRQTSGDEVSLFNGRDGEWMALIGKTGGKKATLEVADHLRTQCPEPDLWLAFAPIKKARLDFIAQKATELGVSKLIPVKTERTIVTRIKTERLVANAKEAAEQCERLAVPEVEDFLSLKKFMASWPKNRKLLFCDEDKSGVLINKALKKADTKPARHPWGILIGPEGGFTDAERKLVRSHPNVVVAALGPRVLRADTAMLSALSLWQATLGDW